MRRKPKPHRDPVTAEVRLTVLQRDRYSCTGPALGFPDACAGPLELDHVTSAGLGRRGPSTPWNLLTLCRLHHRWKTEHSRAARQAQLVYLHRLYPEHVTDPQGLG